MTENRRQVSVTITGQQRAAIIRAVTQRDARTVTIEARPAHYVPPTYEGDYDVTPGAEPVVLATSGRLMTGNVTVAAIPSNYGRITWDGSRLTVS